MNRRRDRAGVIVVTLVVAVVLTLITLPPALDALRPYWVALVLIYWCLETQGLITLGIAFSIGLLHRKPARPARTQPGHPGLPGHTISGETAIFPDLATGAFRVCAAVE